MHELIAEKMRALLQPPFEERFSLMRDLYVSLPWNGIKKDR